VTATYELGEGMKGTIGIIGPKRMDYDKVVGVMKEIMNQLDALYRPAEAGTKDPADGGGTGTGIRAESGKPDQPFTLPDLRIPQIKRIEIKEL